MAFFIFLFLLVFDKEGGISARTGNSGLMFATTFG
jgi:hypothetical protein